MGDGLFTALHCVIASKLHSRTGRLHVRSLACRVRTRRKYPWGMIERNDYVFGTVSVLVLDTFPKLD